MRKLLIALIAAGVFCVVANHAPAVEFVPLGQDWIADGISADGRVVIGFFGRLRPPIGRWTRQQGWHDLNGLPEDFIGTPRAVSADGSVVAGGGCVLPCLKGWEPFRWSETGGFQSLAELSRDFSVVISDVSADGSLVVGTGHDLQSDLIAFYWTETGGLITLDNLPGHEYATVSSVSAGGTVIAGWSGIRTGPRGGEADALVWTLPGGRLKQLGKLPGAVRSDAFGISPDGTVIVGSSGDLIGASIEAFRWTEAGGTQGLGHLPGDAVSGARYVSGDGSVIVGESQSRTEAGLQNRTFIWDEAHGMRDLKDVLTDAGLDVSGWTLRLPTGLSDDGTKIVGWGYNRGGVEESWLVDLSSNIAGDTNGDGVVDAEDLDNVRNHFGAIGPGDGTLDGDAYPFDGIVNIDDLNAVRNNFGAGAAAAPEPGAGVLAVLGIVVALGARRYMQPRTRRPKIARGETPGI